MQSLEAAELLEKALSSSAGRTDSATSVGGVSGLPEALGKFTGHWTGAHCVALSQVQVTIARHFICDGLSFHRYCSKSYYLLTQFQEL